MVEERHIFSVLVENRFGVLARIAGLFSGRGYNIDSLNVAETDDPGVSHMTIVTHGDAQIVEQIYKHLNKLIDVIKVTDLTAENHVERELVLIKMNATPNRRGEILQIMEIFRARAVDVSPATLTIEVTGDEGKLKAVVDMLRPYGIQELVRTGKIAIMRGAAK
ncbi:MAG: acetolactate synthase small subunit [Candidatus Poribacteria bacterium]|nr:acetolactate synthase small subunit [Candidatus Poribacteria bacterium]